MSNSLYYSYRKIIRVAVPVIVGGIAQNIVSVTDTVFLGRLNETALGAAGNGGIFYFFIVMLGLGLVTGAQILMGNHHGARRLIETGRVFTHTAIMLLPLSILLYGILRFAGVQIFEWFLANPSVRQQAVLFVEQRSAGVFFAMFNFLIIAFYTAITETKVISWVTIIMSAANVFLDYAMIFGHFGFQPQGVKGAALASVYSEGIASGLFLGVLVWQGKIRRYGLFGLKTLKIRYFIQIVRIGFPVMMQYIISIGSWFTFFMLIEKLGKTALASAHIVRSIYMVLMIPLFGFSNTTNTLVSNMTGAGDKEHLPVLIRRILLLCLSVTLALFVVVSVFPEEILRVFTRIPELQILSLQSLSVIGYTMFFFSVAFILFNVVLGAGYTLWALLIELATIVIYLWVVYIITVAYPQPLHIVWMSEFVYFTLLGIFSWWVIKKKILIS